MDRKANERSTIQKEIGEIVAKREAFIAAEKAKAATSKVSTLESEIEKTIRQQVKRFNMRVD